jgi:hypothetical protein
VNGLACSCSGAWSGLLCETPSVYCLSTPCQNGGVCTEDAVQYSCVWYVMFLILFLFFSSCDSFLDTLPCWVVLAALLVSIVKQTSTNVLPILVEMERPEVT